MIKLLLSNFGSEWHLKASVLRGIPFKIQKLVLHADWSYKKNTSTWYATVWRSLSQTKMLASYLVDLPGGCDYHGETTSPRLCSSSFLLFSRNTIIKQPCHRQLALKYDADSKVLDKLYCHFTSLGVTAFSLQLLSKYLHR